MLYRVLLQEVSRQVQLVQVDLPHANEHCTAQKLDPVPLDVVVRQVQRLEVARPGVFDQRTPQCQQRLRVHLHHLQLQLLQRLQVLDVPQNYRQPEVVDVAMRQVYLLYLVLPLQHVSAEVFDHVVSEVLVVEEVDRLYRRVSHQCFEDAAQPKRIEITVSQGDIDEGLVLLDCIGQLDGVVGVNGAA